MNPYLTTDEVEIDLLDLGRYLLRRIGWILLVGIVCAGIAAAYKYHSLSDPKAIRKAAPRRKIRIFLPPRLAKREKKDIVKAHRWRISSVG